MLDSENYSGIVKFFLESLEEVIRGECKAVGRTEYIGTDFVVFLDGCMSAGVITEHMYASLMKLKEISRKFSSPVTFIPDSRATQLIKSNSWKYDVSPMKSGGFIREDAMEILRISYDFLLEHQQSHNDRRYEPYLSLFHNEFIKS